MNDLGCTLEERVRTLDYALAVDLLLYSTNASLVTEGGLVGMADMDYVLCIWSCRGIDTLGKWKSLVRGHEKCGPSSIFSLAISQYVTSKPPH